jgi:hypothetical protein
MKNKPANQRKTPPRSRQSLPAYISAMELRARLPLLLEQLEATRGTVIVCRYNKPAAILRGGTDRGGQPVIHFIPVRSRTGRAILQAASQSA